MSKLKTILANYLKRRSIKKVISIFYPEDISEIPYTAQSRSQCVFCHRPIEPGDTIYLVYGLSTEKKDSDSTIRVEGKVPAVRYCCESCKNKENKFEVVGLKNERRKEFD